jgi:hypothetical protein
VSWEWYIFGKKKRVMDVLAFCTAAHCQLPSMDCFVRGQTRISEVDSDPKSVWSRLEFMMGPGLASVA